MLPASVLGWALLWTPARTGPPPEATAHAGPLHLEARVETRIDDKRLAQHSVVYSAFAVVRANPRGLAADAAVEYRARLSRRRDTLHAFSHAGMGVYTMVTPAFVRVGPRLELHPWSFLRVRTGYLFTQWFGALGSVQGFDSARVDASPSALQASRKQGYAVAMHAAHLELLLQVALGPVVIRNTLWSIYETAALRGAQRVWYDALFDVLAPKRGFRLQNDSDVLVYAYKKKLLVGVRYTLAHTFLARADTALLRPDAPGAPVSPTHRVGPGVIYTFFDRPGARFDRPSLLLLLQWWAKHSYRTGSDVHGAIPNVALGFAFTGQLFGR